MTFQVIKIEKLLHRKFYRTRILQRIEQLYASTPVSPFGFANSVSFRFLCHRKVITFQYSGIKCSFLLNAHENAPLIISVAIRHHVNARFELSTLNTKLESVDQVSEWIKTRLLYIEVQRSRFLSATGIWRQKRRKQSHRSSFSSWHSRRDRKGMLWQWRERESIVGFYVRSGELLFLLSTYELHMDRRYAYNVLAIYSITQYRQLREVLYVISNRQYRLGNSLRTTIIRIIINWRNPFSRLLINLLENSPENGALRANVSIRRRIDEKR